MDKLKAALAWLKGKRTYMLAAIGGLVVALAWSGLIDQDTANKILQLLGFGAVAALRAAK